MSDENQPNEVVESQLKPETVPVKPQPAPTLGIVEPMDVSRADSVQSEATPMETPVEAGPYADMEAQDAVAVSPSIVSIAELEASKPSMGEKVSAFLTGVGALFRGRRWLLGVLAA